MRLKFKKIRTKRLALFLILCIVVISTYFYIQTQYKVLDSSQLRSSFREQLKLSNYSIPDGPACQFPNLDIDGPEIRKFFKNSVPVICADDEDWIKVFNGTAHVTEKAKIKHGKISCQFTDIIRATDYLNRNGKTTHSDFYKFIDSDFVRVTCDAEDGSNWKTILSSIRQDPRLKREKGWEYLPNDAVPLNVLIWGFDSLSRNTFIRKLPLTYQYLTKELKAIVLKGYNIVGDGTPQALTPILTGKSELDLPEVRHRLGSAARYVNVYPFVWNDFRSHGYVTGYTEDQPNVGTYQFRLKGFLEQPVDHYGRTFYLEAAKEFKKTNKLCLGSLPRHHIMMDYVKEMFRVHHDKPKFMFAFHSELSHDDYNLVGAADNDTLQLLQFLHNSNFLNNTLLLVMSDHGHRFTGIRNTQQGKLEERMPMFSFVLPPWFALKYPNSVQNLIKNQDRLTTPFDINPTLRSLLHFRPPRMGTLKDRGINLFDEVPINRNCFDAHIEPHWCTCLEWIPTNPQDLLVRRAADFLIDEINTYTSGDRDICATLKLGVIQWVGFLTPNQNLLRFQNSQDADGFIPSFGDPITVKTKLYQIKITAEPGGGIFEATVTYFSSHDTFHLKIEDVSRINKYGNQARCLNGNLAHLRKFCYCVRD